MTNHEWEMFYIRAHGRIYRGLLNHRIDSTKAVVRERVRLMFLKARVYNRNPNEGIIAQAVGTP